MTAAFGLYNAPDLLPAQRVAAGLVLALDTPLADAGGAMLFRRSHWLPLPEQLPTVQALRLAGSDLRVHFAPRRFGVPIGNTAWFSQRRYLGDQHVRLEFTWPATVVAIPGPTSRSGFEFELFRVDGDQVATKATAKGRTGTDLAEPWIGSPLEVAVGAAFSNLDFVVAREAVGTGAVFERAAPVAGGSGSSSVGSAAVQSEVALLAAAPLSALTLRGVPTSPRLKLFAEGPGDAPDTLLWQALLPGEQGAVDLPPKPVAEEWAAAFEQLQRLAQKPVTRPDRLRLDIESDAPCTVTLQALQLALELDFELLDKPLRFDFDGLQPASSTMALALPPGGSITALHLAGTVAVLAGADAGGALPADARVGALAELGLALLQPLRLAVPAALAGVALAWQPLSSAVKGRVRLLADAGGAPSAQVLAESALDGTGASTGWLALRWPAVDLQAQALWVELSLAEGSGLWIFDAASSAAPGLAESRGPTTTRWALPQALGLRSLGATPADAKQRALGVALGSQVLTAALPTGALDWKLPEAALAQLRSQPLAFNAGAPGSVTVDSALLSLRL